MELKLSKQPDGSNRPSIKLRNNVSIGKEKIL